MGKKIAGTMLGSVLKIIITIVIVFFVYRFAMSAYGFGYRVFTEPPVSEASKEVVTVAIAEGKSALEIGKILEKNGLIRDAKLFAIAEIFSSYNKEIKPGIYDLSPAMTMEEMMKVMSTTDQPEEETEVIDESEDTEPMEEEPMENTNETEDLGEGTENPEGNEGNE